MNRDRIRRHIHQAITDAVPWLNEKFECAYCRYPTIIVRQVGVPARTRWSCAQCGGKVHEMVDEFVYLGTVH